MSEFPEPPAAKPAPVKRPLTNSPQAKPQRRQTSSWWIGLGAALAIVMVIWLVPFARGPGGQLALERDATGRLVAVATDGAAAVDMAATTIDAKNFMSHSVVTHHSANSAFPCRRVTIINYSDHPLLAQIGELLPKHLSALRFVEHVAYVSAHESLPAGGQAADLWITLDLDHLTKTTGVLPVVKLDATITVTAGSTLAEGSYRKHDHNTPPTIGLYWQASVHHKSTTSNISSDKFSFAANNITDYLAEQLTAQLQEQHDKFGPLPPLREAFYPAYLPTPATLTFGDLDAQQICSSHGLMFRNETYWRVVTTDPVPGLLKGIQARFESAGWKTEHFNESEGQPHLNLARDDVLLSFFAARGHGHESRISIQVGAEQSEPSPEPKTIYIRYLNRLNRAELRNAVQEQLAAGGPLKSLLLLSTKYSQQQRVEFMNCLEQEQASSFKAWLTLATEYEKTKQPDKARRALRRAHWLAQLDPAHSGQTAETMKLAEDLDAEEILKAPPSAELFEDLGIVELTEGTAPKAVEVGLNQLAMFHTTDSNGDWHIISWRVKRAAHDPRGEGREFAQSHLSQRSGTWGSGASFPRGKVSRQEQEIGGLAVIKLEIEEQTSETYRIVAQVGSM